MTPGPASSTVLSLDLHICPCLYLIVFSCSSSFPSQRQYSQRICQQLLFLNYFIHSGMSSYRRSSVPCIACASPSSSLRASVQDTDQWTASLPCLFVQIFNTYSCIFYCTTSCPWESLPCRSADGAQGLLPAPPMELCTPCQNSNSSMKSWWAALLLGCASLPAGIFPPMIPNLSTLFHFYINW